MSNFKVYIVVGLVIASQFAIIGGQRSNLKKITEEKDRYVSNTNILLDSIKTYQSKDGIQVASIGNLELKLSEYQKYRFEDYVLIQSLKVDKNRLEQITTAQSQTIYDLKGSVKDSVVYRDNYIIDTLRCISIHNNWFDLTGCSDRTNTFSGKLENRDSLIYVEHIVPKRFLGFLWKYGIKERRQEIVSKNPNTKIINAEYISIKK